MEMMKKFEALFLSCHKAIERLKVDLESTEKSPSDLVTNVDLGVEKILIDFIKSEFPNDLIISEESLHGQLTHAPTWVMDPIDGTNNFVNGSKLYGIQLCRLVNREATLAALYLPDLKDFYFATKEDGAYCNGQPLIKQAQKPLHLSIVSFGGFSKSSLESRVYEMKLMDYFKDRAMGIRIFGSSCMDFTAVASGQTQAHIMFSKRIWEIAAGVFIAEMAGIFVERIQVRDTEVTAICAAHSEDALETIRSLLNA